MYLIVDSGSSKSRWAIGPHPWRYVTAQGLNPRLTDDATFRSVIGTVCATPDNVASCTRIDFYGAGCGNPIMQERVRALLLEFFPQATVCVEGDLLGACRALCGDHPGAVAILGTGSNACYYDGTRIVRQSLSTGYLLGDEGSGNHIGRRLLKDYLAGRMPSGLARQLADQFPESNETILHRLYSEPYPNRYLASFAPFAVAHREHAYLQALLSEVFSAFWREMVMPIADGGVVHLAGGIAAALTAEIVQSAPSGYSVGQVLQEPLEGLISHTIKNG